MTIMKGIYCVVLFLCVCDLSSSQPRVPPGVPPQQYAQQVGQVPHMQQQQMHQQVPVQHQVPMHQQQVPQHQVPVQQQQYGAPVVPQHVPVQQQQQQHVQHHVQQQQHVQHVQHAQPGQLLNVAHMAHENKEHMKEHLEVPIDTSNMSEQELQFHYFKMHDADNNNKLDGCELIKSLIHWHEQGHHHDPGAQIPPDQQGTKLFTDQELVSLIDPILSMDDTNRDGFIDYPEFVQAQHKAAATSQVKA